MTEKIRQTFEPAFYMQDSNNELHKITTRTFEVLDKKIINGQFIDENNNPVEIKNMGQYVIEEIWKRYRDTDIWVSNYGYVAKIIKEKVGEEMYNLFNEKEEIHFHEESVEKDIIRRCSFLPNDNSNESMEINLYVKETGKNLYDMVAETFISSDEEKTAVHHIDNNSYNNSITNLFLVPNDIHSHNGDIHSRNSDIHPFSFRSTIKPEEEA